MKRSPAQDSSLPRHTAGYWTAANSPADGHQSSDRTGDRSVGGAGRAGNGPDEFPAKSPDSEELWDFPW